MKILVTGATGNVGRLAVDHLLGKGAEVRALTINPARATLPHDIEVVEGLNVGDQVILSDMSAQDQNPRIRLN